MAGTPDLTNLTADELRAVMQDASAKLQAAQQTAMSVEETLRTQARADVGVLANLLGGAPVDRALPADTIQALLAANKATINTDPGKFILAILQILRLLVAAQLTTSQTTGRKFELKPAKPVKPAPKA